VTTTILDKAWADEIEGTEGNDEIVGTRSFRERSISGPRMFVGEG
jgi:hypothetical protein